MSLWEINHLTCQQLRPALIVLELAPLTPRKMKRRQNHPEIHKLHNISCPPPLHGGRGGVSKMAPVPEGHVLTHQKLAFECQLIA